MGPGDDCDDTTICDVGQCIDGECLDGEDLYCAVPASPDIDGVVLLDPVGTTAQAGCGNGPSPAAATRVVVPVLDGGGLLLFSNALVAVEARRGCGDGAEILGCEVVVNSARLEGFSAGEEASLAVFVPTGGAPSSVTFTVREDRPGRVGEHCTPEGLLPCAADLDCVGEAGEERCVEP